MPGIRIRIDASEAQSASDSLRRNFIDVAGEAQKAETRLKSFTSTIQKAFVGIGAAAVAAAIAKVGSEAESANAKIRAATGAAEKEVQKLGKVAQSAKVYIGDMAGATDSVIQAYQQMGKVSDSEMQKVLKTVGALNQTFAVDTPKSITAISTLMKDFGLTSQQAMDFVSGGFQKGLDKSGDFLDSVLEYSTQFKSGGADAFFGFGKRTRFGSYWNGQSR